MWSTSVEDGDTSRKKRVIKEAEVKRGKFKNVLNYNRTSNLSRQLKI